MADHFLKTSRESEIRPRFDFTYHRSIREELRAEEILKEKTIQILADKTYHDKELTQYEVEDVVPRYLSTSPGRITTHEPIQEQRHEKDRDYGPSL